MTDEATIRRTGRDQVPDDAVNARHARPSARMVVNRADHRLYRWAARLQAATASGKPVLLRVDYDAGHGLMDATRGQTIAFLADNLSFVLRQSGDAAFQPKP